jgi:hypothetical protein
LNLFKIGKNLFYVNDATIILIGKGGESFYVNMESFPRYFGK